ncbi:MFS transporter [Seleniivibrio sp.]|uniref:MFS transporter n=1 Tax=Seleniivibrio sp. TaxID=2898801 RepID=UPI0025E1E3C8|nr:MFS transporter [Seleniivibrio sp.]MCD8552374.1 MFS transporter [Seleniivibrio sp.]
MLYNVPLKLLGCSNDGSNRVLGTLFVINLLITIGFTSFNTFLPLFLKEVNFSGTIIGIIVSTYSISKLFSSVFMGVLVDKINKKKLMLILLSMFTVLSFLCFRIDNFYTVIAVRIFQGIFFALFRPLIFSILCENISIEQSAKMISSLDLSFYIATCAGPLLGGFIREIFGYYGLLSFLVLLTGISFVFFIITTGNMKRIDEVKERTSPDESGLNIFTPKLCGLCIFIMGKGCMLSLLLTIAPIMLPHYDISISGIGFIISLLSISMILFIKPAVRLSGFIGIYPIISVGSLVVSALFFIIPSVNVVGIAIVFALIGIFSAMSQPASSAILAYEGRKVGFGFASGIFNFFMNLGFVAGPLFGTYLMESIDIKYVFYFAGGIGVFSWIAFIIVSRTCNDFSGCAELSCDVRR